MKTLSFYTVILFGVAHKARQLNLENLVAFDSYDCRKGPYGDVKVSGLREEIMSLVRPVFCSACVTDCLRIEYCMRE